MLSKAIIKTPVEGISFGRMGFHFLVARDPILFYALFCLLLSVCVYPAKLLITALVLLLVNYAFGLAGHAAGKLCF